MTFFIGLVASIDKLHTVLAKSQNLVNNVVRLFLGAAIG